MYIEEGIVFSMISVCGFKKYSITKVKNISQQITTVLKHSKFKTYKPNRLFHP